MAKILAADIGGTNSRFALFSASGGILTLEDSIWLKTHEAGTFPELLERLWASPFAARPGRFDAAVLAVAGAVRHGVECRHLPNAPWGVDLREVDFGCERACLINDFAAQAFACRTSAVEGALVLQAGEADADAPVGVIGAGTGLGYSALIRDEGRWIALPSEGGHMAFPFTGMEEAEYGEFNRTASGRNWAEGDSVVTGLGLRLVPGEPHHQMVRALLWSRLPQLGHRPHGAGRAVHSRRRGSQEPHARQRAGIHGRVPQFPCLR
jgi:glucokinase